MNTAFTINGTHCGACKMILEEDLLKVPGVQSATVDFETGKTEIEHEGPLDMGKVKQAVEDGGNYSVTLPTA